MHPRTCQVRLKKQEMKGCVPDPRSGVSNPQKGAGKKRKKEKRLRECMPDSRAGWPSASCSFSNATL